MQDDDTANPGQLWVLEGEALWKQKAGAAGARARTATATRATSMKGVAARHPAWTPRPGGR